MKRKNKSERKLRIRARNHILMQGNPRFFMFLVLTATLITAFLISALLLNLGVVHMWLRYGLAAIAAYGAFFLYLHILLFYIYKIRSDQKEIQEKIEEAIDTVTDLDIDDADVPASGSSSTSSGLDASDLFGEGEFAAVILGIIMIGGIMFASFYVVYIAPEILFEMAFDAFVGFGYYRVMKSRENRHWSEGAIKSTIVPFLITLALVVTCGALIQFFVPEAVRLKDIFKT